MDGLLLGLGFLIAVILSALFSGLETGLYTTSRLRLFLDAHAGVVPAQRARALLADMPTLLSVLLVSNNAANSLASTLAQALLIAWGVASPELVGTLGVSVVLFLLAESVPKSAFRRAHERLLYPALAPLWVTHGLLRWPVRPLAWLVRRLTGAVQLRLRTQAGRSNEPREAMLREGAAEGFLSPFQERVARGVLTMRSRQALDEAQPVEHFATARMGVRGVLLPTGCRDQRVLVLDATGSQLVGWIPLARLVDGNGFRAPRRDELHGFQLVDPQTGLDRVYLTLQRESQPFAALRGTSRLSVIDAARLRQRVMGTFGQPSGAVL
ncbi:MAG: hypothetical protein DHS20C15_03520 [Planctomycetota bacterium]|nr:MAG: hypothetical protein DHS20C15_03520 [Planctomycetota bacterium]